MAKAKEVFTIIRYWRENDLDGVDILGSTRNYSDAAKIIEDMVDHHPYAHWETEETDMEELAATVIEDYNPNDYREDLPMFMDMYENIDLENFCRYKIGNTTSWTYAWFYVATTEIMQP